MDFYKSTRRRTCIEAFANDLWNYDYYARYISLLHRNVKTDQLQEDSCGLQIC